ncbi:MAG: hypothetical protein HYX66_09005 [Ignavibacteria bacterium]|nr:hypothetical protein [Ignavibacteria bacterium]
MINSKLTNGQIQGLPGVLGTVWPSSVLPLPFWSAAEISGIAVCSLRECGGSSRSWVSVEQPVCSALGRTYTKKGMAANGCKNRSK